MRFHEVAELPGSARAEGGFGSTGGHAARWSGCARAGIDTLRSYPTGKDSDVFGRRKKNEAAEDAAERAPSRSSTSVDAERRRRGRGARAAARIFRPRRGPTGPGTPPRSREPGEGRVDLGGLFVPGVEGMELRVEVAGDAIVAATVVLQDSAVQLQAFAAPKREGIWGEVREEIASGITQQGGVIDEVEGPLGWELRAQVPVQLPDGTDGVQVVRFVGVDGPRWFLRGVISGPGRGAAAGRRAAGADLPGHRRRPRRRPDGAPRPDRPEAAGRRPDGARGCAAGAGRAARASPAAWASCSADRRSPRSAEQLRRPGGVKAPR